MPNSAAGHRGSKVPSPIPATNLGTMAVGVVAVAALYFGRELFVPLALAILLGFALGPPVLLLRHLHVGRVPSVIIVVVLAFLTIGGIGAFVGSQLAHLAGELPGYQTNIIQKIHSLRDTTTKGGIVDRTFAMLTNLDKEIEKPIEKEAPSPPNRPAPLALSHPPQNPAPVEAQQSKPSPLLLLPQIAAPLLQPLVTAGIVVVFVIFFLLQRQDLRDRFIRLAGARDLQRTTHALDDAARRLSRYLLAQTAINTSVGVLVGTGLWLIGAPNPALWGILTILLRFVPYIGPVIAVAFPAALAIAVDPGWMMLLWVIGLFLVVELITGNVIEPWLYGHSMGLSGVAVVVAATFWTLLWGPIGLLLSTPLTMCLVVLGRHVEHLKFLEVLLGDQPVLEPEESFYQRMLADDPDEAADQAEAFLKDKPLSVFYDEVAIRGLALAQLDVNRGMLDHIHRVRIKEAAEWVIDDLSDHDDAPASLDEAATKATPAPGWQATPILCVSGRGSLDEAAAAMLAQLLNKQGISARVVSSEAVSVANLVRLDAIDVQVVCLSYLEPGSFSSARYLTRRLRRKLPQAKIFAGFWTLTDQEVGARDALAATHADLVVTSLRQAVEQILNAEKEAAIAYAELGTVIPLGSGSTGFA
jgi:predicted PurR-regulated permease PerM